MEIKSDVMISITISARPNKKTILPIRFLLDGLVVSTSSCGMPIFMPNPTYARMEISIWLNVWIVNPKKTTTKDGGSQTNS
jgi:hypothetical protein